MDNAAQPSSCMQAHRAAEGERSQDEPGEDPLEDGASVPHTGCGAGRLRGPVHSRHAAGGQEGGELVLRQGAAFKTAVVYAFLIFLFFFNTSSRQSPPLSPSDCLQVTEMLEEAERGRLGCPLTPEKPLIRLRVRPAHTRHDTSGVFFFFFF